MPTRRFRTTVVALSVLGGLLAASHGFSQGAPPQGGQGGRPQGGAPQAAGSSAAHATAPSVRAVRVTERVAVDGRLNDAAWSQAPAVTEFTQVNPTEGEPATERTEIRIVYDQDAIYVGAYMYDSGPVTTRLVRRDAFAQDSDWLEVMFDSFHDHLTQSTFAVNPSGVRRDMTGAGFGGGGGGGGPGGFGGGGGGGGGSEWNPVWDVATAVTDSGWIAEMRIPFSQLRFSPAQVQTWGVQFERTIVRKREETMFAFVRRNERGGPARFGHLEGLEGIEATDPLEIVPYVSGRADYRLVPRNSSVDFGNPFRDGSDFNGGIGGDLQYRLSSNFTLNATINPDFGQVEVDPAVINLTAFETRLQENRPFFIEGADIFRYGGGGGMGGAQLLYSRRIGRAPSLRPSGAAYSDIPDQARILGAAKLTGRTANGWSIGILEAVTNKEWAPFVNNQGEELRTAVEPLANYFTGRVRRDFNGGLSTLGAIFTSANRKLDEASMESQLRDQAYAAGVDFRHDWANRVWSVQGQLSPSYIHGSQAVILAAQNSSARYFARPDAEHLSVDSAATSLLGYAADVNVGKRSGAWTGSVGLAATSPGYEVNDLGFQTTADRISLNTELGYRQNTPGRIFRNWGIGTGPDLTWNYGGNLVMASNGIRANGQFANYWGGFLNFQHRFSTLNDRLTRGGPLSRDPSSSSVGMNINSDSRKAYTIGGGFNVGWDEAGSDRRSAEFNIGIKPAGNWDIRIGPEISLNHQAAQFVQIVNDARATNMFGRRYVFADLHQTEVSLETRLNVNFTPNLSFELYAQPLISSGDYGELKELSAPREFAFNVYGKDAGSTISGPDAGGRFTVDPDGAGPASTFRVNNRDFNSLSLRGNAVLRWEWRPGSTLFLVWQQSRAEQLSALEADAIANRVGQFDFGRDAGDLFGLRPDNLFMIKMTYWLNP